MNKQIVLVIGGPGKSGSTTIAEMLAKHFGLKRIYGGRLIREVASKKGYKDLDDYLKNEDPEEIKKFDKLVDQKLRNVARSGDVVIESKIFAAIATKEKIPCSAKIWLDADMDVRVQRALEKEGIKNPVARWIRKIQIKKDLITRYKIDKERYEALYGIDYDSPEKYNDLVIDNSDQSVDQTFNLIVNFLENAGIKKKHQ
jgi:predicted cytidylate kinase